MAPTFDNENFDPKDLTETPDLPQLRHFLQAALQIELTTIPLYLTAMYSIRPGANEESFYVMRSVVLEEMLHMTLAANLINALGGKPILDKVRNIPHYPAKAPYSAESVAPFPLRHFSPEALDMFIAIESPPYGKPHWDDRGWHTIGQFYGIIDRGLRNLVEREGEKAVFLGEHARQVGPDDFYNSGGEAFAVTDLASARKAIEVIVEEGEGLDESIFSRDDRLFDEQRQEAHYFRFRQIRHARRYGPHDTPSDRPSGAPIEVDWSAAYAFKPGAMNLQDPRMASAKKLIDGFNAQYTGLIKGLNQAFNGQPQVLRDAIPAMLELRYLAEEIHRTPHPLHEGLHLHPTYQVRKDLLEPSAAAEQAEAPARI
ncbi:ferritin-like protein [Saccharopolyspora sp. NFXS83]|uniref:ferritin-like domain-containing protein n=1 Tax=Saccharopolyspora sp. NFXS83 TaxID=2993560 RepID=UPI00224B48EE|nr:ferritin-like protein [Saccharopolyspora sp. NFXS83]MCX2729273.1 ferritin-like protein [Saccharopolyspora sp. NFXS83]